MVASGPKTAIIGAGMAGLTCAQALMQRGVDVVVFDKSRGLGGRIATRRADGGFQFDHGAQYLTPKTAGFSAMLSRAHAAGAVMPWTHDGKDAVHVGVPGMTGLAKYQSLGLTIRREALVNAIIPMNRRWKLVWGDGEDVFDRVVVTAPAPQIGALLPEGHSFNAALDTVEMDPCLTLMVGMPFGVKVPFVSRRTPDEDIAWVVCDSDKPGRPDTTCIVAQAGRDWSMRHLELERDAFAQMMLPLVAEVIGADLVKEQAYVSGHRWRYAFVSRPLGQPFLMSEDQTLFAGGDWCLGARAEDAWSSGQAIAQKITDGM